MNDLDDKIAVVTGGGSGIGACVGKSLINAGVKVVAWDLQFHDNNDAPELTKFECDVADEDSVIKALDKTCRQVAVPDFLINCAGVIDGSLLVSDKGPAPLESFEKVLAVNLTGSFNTMRLVAQKMSEKHPYNSDGERGVVINMSSIAAFEGQIGQVAYAASKGGIVSMTLPAARELGRYGVRVNAIAPGVVETPMMAGVPEKIQDRLKSSIPFPKRYAHPDEIADLVCHILQNPMMNGEVVRIDGGMRMPFK